MNRLLLVSLFFLAGAASPAFGQFVGSENFSAALGANWASPVNTITGIASGQLAQSSSNGGIVDWTPLVGSIGSAGSYETILRWAANTGVTNADWSVTLAVNHTFNVAPNERVSIGLVVRNTGNANDQVQNLLHRTNFGTATNVFHSSLRNNGSVASIADSAANIGSAGSLAISFNSSTQTLSTFYTVGSGWVPMGSFSLSSWSTVTGFDVGIHANAYRTVDGGEMNVPAGTVYADNFSLSASPIPEPSTYAAIFGLVSLVGAYAWRRRDRA
jgi:hypothetical protein